MKKVALRALCAGTVLLGLLVLPGAASATDGSYTIGNSGWTQPSIYNQGFLLQGTTVSPPAGVPAGALITNVTGYLTWQMNPPSGLHYEAVLCEVVSAACAPWGSQLGQGVSGNTAAFAGLPADTTQFYVAAGIHCTCTSSHPAVSPPRYTFEKSMTVHYTY
jgi:hypothetical protein